jgi:hypothetical protein
MIRCICPIRKNPDDVQGLFRSIGGHINSKIMDHRMDGCICFHIFSCVLNLFLGYGAFSPRCNKKEMGLMEWVDKNDWSVDKKML